MSESTSEILNRAADEIEKYGWTTGPLGWHRGNDVGLCIEGGILAAMGLTYGFFDAFEECPAYLAVCDYLATDVPLFAWNDDIARDAQDVLDTLRGAAKVQLGKEQSA